jgi:hypothetical protein
VNPIVAVFLGWLILGEPITARTLFAAAVIIAGVVLITLSRRPPASQPEPSYSVKTSARERASRLRSVQAIRRS